jgi:hypothetical protein
MGKKTVIRRTRIAVLGPAATSDKAEKALLNAGYATYVPRRYIAADYDFVALCDAVLRLESDDPFGREERAVWRAVQAMVPIYNLVMTVLGWEPKERSDGV